MTIASFASAIALMLASAAPADADVTAAPLAPMGTWEVNYRPDACTMGRIFSHADGNLIVAFHNTPLSSITELRMRGPRGLLGDNPARVAIKINGVTTAAREPSKKMPVADDGDARVVRALLPRTVLQFAAQQVINIDAGPHPIDISVGQSGRALSALKTCETELMKSWKIDPVILKDIAKAAKISGNPGVFFGPFDYPPEALRAKVQGRLIAVLEIDIKGRVSNCRIVVNAGSNLLDHGTCVSARKVTFEPARNAHGLAIASPYVLPVNWILPDR